MENGSQTRGPHPAPTRPPKTQWPCWWGFLGFFGLRIVVAAALIAGLAFVATESVALVARLAFIAERAGGIRGNSFFQLFNFQLNFLLHFVSPPFLTL